MTDKSPRERSVDEAFKAAQKARIEGRLDEAIELFAFVLQQCAPEESQLRAGINGMLGDVERKRGNLSEAEAYSRRAIGLIPRSELASVGMFHALWDQGKWLEALEEVVRLVSQRDSEHYRNLLSHGFSDDLDGDQLALANKARAILNSYTNEA